MKTRSTASAPTSPEAYTATFRAAFLYHDRHR